VEKSSQNFWATSAIFHNTYQIKQSPNGRKFAQYLVTLLGGSLKSMVTKFALQLSQPAF
jgi:hypothetical protein